MIIVEEQHDRTNVCQHTLLAFFVRLLTFLKIYRFYNHIIVIIEPTIKQNSVQEFLDTWLEFRKNCLCNTWTLPTYLRSKVFHIDTILLNKYAHKYVHTHYEEAGEINTSREAFGALAQHLQHH